MTITNEILELERKYVWPPYTQAAVYFSTPHPVIERAEGVFLYDTEGKRYYDMIASWWVNLHGHNHPALNQALIDQVGKVAHCAMASQTHEAAVRLAAELVELMPPDMTRVFYSDDGSTAVEVAMKMAFQYFQNIGESKRTRFAAFTNAYHGDTLGTVAVGGVELFHEVFRPTLFPVVRIPAPTCRAVPYGESDADCGPACFEDIKAALLPHVDELCAVLIEPLVQGATGMAMYSPHVLAELRAFCDEHGILIIDDEVAMGFGRTGKAWAFEHADMVPDIVCAAKGLTGGYLPLAVTIASEKIYEAFLGEAGDTRTFYHGHSFTGNPLGAAISRASMKLLREERLPELPAKTRALGEVLDGYRSAPWAREVRQWGMVGAFDLCHRDGSVPDPSLGTGRAVASKALEHGIYLRPLGDTIYFMPPLSITEAELKDMAERLANAIDEVVK